jgi:hypothetical protein
MKDTGEVCQSWTLHMQHGCFGSSCRDTATQALRVHSINGAGVTQCVHVSRHRNKQVTHAMRHQVGYMAAQAAQHWSAVQQTMQTGQSWLQLTAVT